MPVFRFRQFHFDTPSFTYWYFRQLSPFSLLSLRHWCFRFDGHFHFRDTSLTPRFQIRFSFSLSFRLIRHFHYFLSLKHCRAIADSPLIDTSFRYITTPLLYRLRFIASFVAADAARCFRCRHDYFTYADYAIIIGFSPLRFSTLAERCCFSEIFSDWR